MKCPKCKNSSIKKLSVLDKNWKSEHRKCNDCGYQAHWCDFSKKSLLEHASNLNQVVDIDGYV